MGLSILSKVLLLTLDVAHLVYLIQLFEWIIDIIVVSILVIGGVQVLVQLIYSRLLLFSIVD